MKRDGIHALWAIEWAVWVIAISAGLYAWFAGVPGLGATLLALKTLGLWVFSLAFTLACIKTADKWASPRHLIGRLFHGNKSKGK